MTEPKYMNRHLHTDIIPHEVVRVVSGRCVVVREMEAIALNKPVVVGSGGFAGVIFDSRSVEYEIKSNPANPEFKVRLHKDGWWRDPGGSRYKPSDVPVKYYDHNF